MARPFYAALAQAFPKAQRTLLVPEPLVDIPGPAHFTDSIVIPVGRRRGWHNHQQLAAHLRDRNFDLALCLPVSWSAVLPLVLAKIPLRLGYSRDGIGFVLQRKLPWRGRGSGEHKSQLYLKLIDLCVSERQAVVASAPVESLRVVGKGAAPPHFVIGPGASLPLREWPYFPELVGRLLNHSSQPVVTLVGAPTDRKWSSRLRRLYPNDRLQDRIGKTTLPELVELCQRATLVVANDSGLAHVAASVAGARTLVLFGPGDPAYVLPVGPMAQAVFQADVACRPCESARCAAPHGYQRCLTALPLELVWQRLQPVLSL